MENYSKEKTNTNEIDLNANLDEYEDFWGDDTALVPDSFDPSILDDVQEMKNAPVLANAPKVTEISVFKKGISWPDWRSKQTEIEEAQKRKMMMEDVDSLECFESLPKKRRLELSKEERELKRKGNNRISSKMHRERKKVWETETFKLVQHLESKIEYYEYVLKEKKLEKYIHLDANIVLD